MKYIETTKNELLILNHITYISFDLKYQETNVKFIGGACTILKQFDADKLGMAIAESHDNNDLKYIVNIDGEFIFLNHITRTFKNDFAERDGEHEYYVCLTCGSVRNLSKDDYKNLLEKL